MIIKSGRLITVEAMSQEQIRTLKGLHDGVGTCTCGRIFTPLSPKFVLGNFVTKHPTDKNLKECVIMAAYCMGCFTQINNVLKNLNVLRDPETNQLRGNQTGGNETRLNKINPGGHNVKN